jgi:hypothetical protein
MYIELYKYVEGDESCENGEYLGYVSLEEEDIYIDLDDERLAERLEELFSEPLSYSRSPLEPEKEIEPYTGDFFRVVPTILPDFGVRGKLQEDDDEEFEEDLEHDDDEMEMEKEEDMPVGISVDKIGSMDDLDDMDDMDDVEDMDEDDRYSLHDDMMDEDHDMDIMDEEDDY